MDYLVTCWCGVPQRFLSKERFLEAKEAGFNALPANYDRELLPEAFRMAEEAGIQLIPEDDRIYQAIKEPERIDELVRAVCEDYRDYPALYGYHIMDEPCAAAYPVLGKIREAFAKYDPKHPAYYNLFPNYASNQMLGTENYPQYVEQFIDVVKPFLVSYDHYHFLQETPHDRNMDFRDARDAEIYAAAQKRVQRPGFYENLEDVRRVSLDRGVPYMLIVLLVQHGPYRYLSRAEIGYEVWQTLAYGCSGISYFTYWTPTTDPAWHYCNGMISEEGERLEHYYDGQAVLREAIPVGKLLAKETSLQVFHIGADVEGAGLRDFVPTEGIRAVTGGHFTAGFFTGNLLVLAGKNYDADETAVLDTDRKLLLFDGESGTWQETGNTVRIPKGSGVLLKIC